MTLTPEEVARFAAAVAGRLGLRVEAARVGELVQRRAGQHRQPIAAYLDRLDADPAELRALTGELTVGETYFLRHIEQFRAFIDVAVPDRIANGRLRVLSAGCSSGEEPYTLATLLREAYPTAAATIHAIDINEQAIARARAGRYSRWSLRAMTPAFESRWFRSDGRDVVIAPEIRAAVTFELGNLLDSALPQPGIWDVVFCRNVIMYFTDRQLNAAIARIARSLAPGGFLFLGHAETLRDRSDDFELCHTHGAFYYRRLPSRTHRTAAPFAVDAPPSGANALDPGWYERIRVAAERVHALADVALVPRSAEPLEPAAGPVEPAPEPTDLAEVHELLIEERFAEALERLDQISADRSAQLSANVSVASDSASRRRDLATLRALVLTHGGRFTEARAACGELLALDAGSAGAHYLLALCCDSVGDPGGAAQRAQIAAALDPSFAMPRLHLGLLARRAGDRALATRELTRAVELLEREASMRLALYGGGFSRQALLAMCRAELAAIGALR